MFPWSYFGLLRCIPWRCPAVLITCFAAGGLLTVQGCSRSGKLEVTGQVSLDDKPLDDGTIDFFPLNGQGPSAAGIIAQGRYSVPIVAGEMRVVIQGFKQVGTQQMQHGAKMITVPIREPIVPKQYNAESQLQVQVDSSHLTHDFPLKSGK